MVLIDALYINNGGGLSLLKVLVDSLEAAKVDVFYLIDERAKHHFTHLSQEKKFTCEAGIINRSLFYKRNWRKFNTVLCFANFPPIRRYNLRIITYFQNVLLIGNGRSEKIKNKFLLFLKKSILFSTRNNTDIWCVQTDATKNLFVKFLPDQKNKLKVTPYWNDVLFRGKGNIMTGYRFLYVSDGHPHKNHLNLLDAWEQLFTVGVNLPLTLTVNVHNIYLVNKINSLRQKGLNITNVGLVSINQIRELYLNNNVTIYPSLEESFGLGIIEALASGQYVLASNLDYVKCIVQASGYFNPLKIDNIVASVLSFINSKEVVPSKLLIENKIIDLVELIRG